LLSPGGRYPDAHVEETPALEGGRLVMPKKPGLGLAFDQAAIKHLPGRVSAGQNSRNHRPEFPEF
jgi:L-alanine-DL-glutamate epimerase-like enolase superfamily enzyme